jgi:Tfp pilus assembly protein PilE
MNQLGINMVDLMMWLVIAALLLAAALQGIGYYQQAAWTYQAKSDVASVRTFMEAQYTLNNNTYPLDAAINAATVGAIATGDLEITSPNTVKITKSGIQGWIAVVESPSLKAANKKEQFLFGSKDNTAAGAIAGSDEGSNNPAPSTGVVYTGATAVTTGAIVY